MSLSETYRQLIAEVSDRELIARMIQSWHANICNFGSCALDLD